MNRNIDTNANFFCKVVQPNRIWVALVALLLLILSGCGEEEKDYGSSRDYGKIRGPMAGYVSVDGLSGLVTMFRDQGRTVRQANRISPRIERFETILWCPNNLDPPSQRAIERLDEWLAGGYYRTLIFVAPGFRGKDSLMRRQVDIAAGEDRAKALRRYNEYLIRKIGYDVWDGGVTKFLNDEDTDAECEWYSQTKGTSEKITRLDGQWGDEIDVAQSDLYSGNLELEIPDDLPMLKVRPGHSYMSRVDRDTEVLLESDAGPLAWRMFCPDNEEFGSVYLFSNGSPLMNLGLANRENRKLAIELIDQTAGDVLVLQSGPGPVEVRDSYAPETSGWEWLQRRPLNTIIPFFLLLSVFAFFAIFPIHGRPRHIETQPKKTFAGHIRATGRLLNSPKNRSWAKKAIKSYRKRIGRE